MEEFTKLQVLLQLTKMIYSLKKEHILMEKKQEVEKLITEMVKLDVFAHMKIMFDMETC